MQVTFDPAKDAETPEEFGTPDADNPQWTKEDFAHAKRIGDLPPQMQTLLRRKRGPQKAPTKVLTALRLSPDVLEALRLTGKGWQSRVDDTLRAAFVKSSNESRSE